jgi:signal transduction histidine kinase
VAIFAGLAWLLVELLSQPGFSHPLIPLWNAAGRTVFFLLLVGYITEVYKRDAWLEAEVQRQTVVLREMISSRKTLEREMAQAVAHEHSQIARELHDGVGQYLAGLALRARGLADGLGQDASPHAARAEELVEKLATTNRMLRRLDHILSPSIAAEGGLAVALGRLVADVRQFSGVECTLDLPKESFVIGEFQALTLFRIAQEAISNSVKHSGTAAVEVRLAVDDIGLRVTVADDGPGSAVRGPVDSGEGLRIMMHRAELIGARLELGSDGRSGWTVECVLPWRGASPVLSRET